MKQKNILIVACVAIVAALSFAACKKDQSAQMPQGKQEFSLYMTDGPGFFDQVLVEIRSVQVLVDTGRDTRRNDTCNWDRIGATPNRKPDSLLVWQDLGVSPGVYDIMNLRNGVDTLLSKIMIPKGAIRLIRILFGTQNNALVKDGVTYPLKWPAGTSDYVLIKLKGHEADEYLTGRTRLWLDFDINRSVAVGLNNYFYLRPFFHFFVTKNSGSVAGKIEPKDAKAVLTLVSGTDTAYGLPDKDGRFKIRGLNDGTYSLYINGSSSYADTTINNIKVTAPKETSIGAIGLRRK